MRLSPTDLLILGHLSTSAGLSIEAIGKITAIASFGQIYLSLDCMETATFVRSFEIPHQRNEQRLYQATLYGAGMYRDRRAAQKHGGS